MSKMAALQVKRHFSNSTDVLFPEEPTMALDDSFYSQPSTSSRSTYSQEVKYIFNPRMVASSPPTSQSEYSEIDQFSVSSNRASTDLFWDAQKDPRNSVCSSGSPGGAALNQKYPGNANGLPSPGVRRMSLDPNHNIGTAEPQYGVSFKPINFSQQRSYSEDSPKATSWKGSSTNLGAAPPSPKVEGSHRTEHKPPVYYGNGSNMTQKYTVTTTLKPKTPPKPRRLHELNSYPDYVDSQRGGQPPQEIYSMPSPSGPVQKGVDKHSQRPPLPPPPPPPPHQPYQQDRENGEFDFAVRRRTWSPPTFNRVMNNSAQKALQATRNYCSNEQLDSVSSNNTYEDLDSISNSSAPPKITPQSGTLTKVPNERIIKPIAFKPVTAQPMRNAPLPPPVDKSSPPSGLPRPPSGPLSPSGPHQPPSGPLSPRLGAHPQSGPLHSPSGPPHPPSGHPHAQSGHPQSGPPQIPLLSPSWPSPHPAFLKSPRPNTASHPASHSQDDNFSAAAPPHDKQSHNLSSRPAAQDHSVLARALNASLDRSRSEFSSHNASSSHRSGGSANGGYPNPYKSNGGSNGSESYPSSNVSKVSSGAGVDVCMTTPSPSDSGVGEMEAILRSKDAEIAQLRDTMEKNESAILQVYERKRQSWQAEVREYADEWDSHLRAQQQKAFKTEQSLLMQLFKLQQERKTLKIEADQHRIEKEKVEKQCRDLTRDLATTKSKAEELQWELHNKGGEVNMLKTQLKDAKDEAVSSVTDMSDLHMEMSDLVKEREQKAAEIRELQTELALSREDFKQLQTKLDETRLELEEAKQTIQKQNDSSNNNDTMTALEMELCKLRTEFGATKTAFQEEKEQWMEEKNKVVRYQKHLQLNYVQMMRKNKMLESDIEQLTLELENRDINLLADGRPVTEEESMC